MALPQPFTTAAPAIASYNYTDIVDGTGVAVYYGNVNEASSISYFLGTSAFTVATCYTSGATMDLTPFATPRTVKGTAILSFYVNASSGARGNVKLQKVDGVTAAVTDISSTIQSEARSALGSLCLKIPLTETLFAQGDILRLVYTQTGSCSLTFNNPSYPLILNVPYKLDL